MVRLQIISGKMAGAETVARRFPFSVGRSSGCDLRLEDEGVWDSHCGLDLAGQREFVLKSAPDALVFVNGESIREKALRNGDTIGIGGAKIRFWLSDTVQRGFRWREWLTWLAFLLILSLEVWLIYALGA